MSFYGIKDNKCREDITQRTPEIASIENLGYTNESSLITILSDYLYKNCMLIYSVSNVTNTNIYPIKIPSTDAAIIIINKVGNSASIEFHFYDEIYVNQYLFDSQTGHHLAGWKRISKIIEFSITINNVSAAGNETYRKDLSNYNIGNKVHAIVTPLFDYGFNANGVESINYRYCIDNRNTFILRVRNNLNSVITGLRFNVCIL